jgi:antitoxin Phd
MPKQYSIAQARNRLPSIVHEVEDGQPVELTRRGKPVAVVMSLRDFRHAIDGHRGFAAALEAFRATTDPRALDFADADFAGLRDRSPGRDAPW